MEAPSGRTVVRVVAGAVALAEVARCGRWGRRAVARAAIAGAAAGVVARRPSATLGAIASGASVEAPTVGLALAVVALTSVQTQGDLALVAGGAGAGLGTTRVWPTAPRTVEELRRHGTKSTITPAPDGAGVSIVVNPGARAADERDTAELLAERLPAATVHVVGEDDDVGEVLARAADEATVALGAAGGDGTISAAARLAHDRGLPLLALPAGTLNHFARDLGLLALDDAVDALQAGQVVHVDLAEVDGRTFVNTLSFGSYTELVDARERLQDRIGKWPAVAVALVTVLRRATPIQIDVDGRRRSIWLAFVGAGRYRPSGFAPSWREVLDDGLLDVRLVDGEQPWARFRLVLSVLTGRLGRSTVYEQRTARSVRLRSADGAPLALALDGERCDVPSSVVVEKRERCLLVCAPHR